MVNVNKIQPRKMKPAVETDVKELVTRYIKAGANILLIGLPGTGKTTILKEACKELNYQLKYFETSLLDPFIDLVGLPVPNQETRTTDFYRPRAIDQADVVFFDEINRADSRTLNTLMELVLFKSINGEKLPKLRQVVAACNPANGDYTVADLDGALLDRFDVVLNVTPSFNREYFNTLTDDETLVNNLAEWWNWYEGARRDQADKPYISPRRMETFLKLWIALPEFDTVANTLHALSEDDQFYLWQQLTREPNIAQKIMTGEMPITRDNLVAAFNSVSDDPQGYNTFCWWLQAQQAKLPEDCQDWNVFA